MQLTSLLNKLLLTNGIQLSKIPKDLALDKRQHPSLGSIVELVGPSGVGKSYFYNHLQPELEGNWFFRKEVKKISTYQGSSFSLLNDEDAALVENLLNKKYENIRSVKGVLQRKVALYDFFLKEMAADVYFRHTKLARGLFSEDGVTHNFSQELLWYHEELTKEGAKGKYNVLQRFFDNRAVIFFDAPTSYIIKNLKIRSSQNPGAGNDWFYYAGEKEVTEFIERSKANKAKMHSVLQKYGVDVLTLDATESLETNKQKVLEFSASVISRNKG
ncbi:hypothetical protein IEI94_10315 [Halomonas sp. ML-15]|uniref:hypothetical protein n=1 Tax=Halomonas sp. ML-15 TaxID=2773305 RepID=UPI001747118C|nr:hypothetical protein [Halomonas sp. ML-15]MBD3896243.1 hypothetical protein [Halomonas sp. ML-15]